MIISYIQLHQHRIEVLDQKKTNAILNLIRQIDSHVLTDNIYLYAKDLNELSIQ